MSQYSTNRELIELIFQDFQRDGSLPSPLDTQACFDLIHDALEVISPEDPEMAALAVRLRYVFDALRNT